MAAFDGTPSTPTGNGRAQVSPGRTESSPQSPSVSPVSARLPGAPAPAVAGVTAAKPPAAVQPSMEQRPAQRAELPSAPASPTQTDKKEDTPDPQKLMLYQNRLALGGVVGNVLGKVRDAMTPQQNKPKTQQSSQATQADATSQQSVQAPQANMEQRFAAFEASRMEPKRDEAKLYAADQSARTALDALNTFSEGPGASILNRIQDAASTTRGGIQQVLAEMRPGGAYEDLRKEFNTVLNDDPDFPIHLWPRRRCFEAIWQRPGERYRHHLTTSERKRLDLPFRKARCRDRRSRFEHPWEKKKAPLSRTLPRKRGRS